MRPAVAAVAALVASAALPAAAARPPVSLVASPSHLELRGGATNAVAVTNTGSQTAVVGVARSGFALDLRGRPRVTSRHARWIAVRPRRLTIAPGATALLRVAGQVPPRAEPGDHPELVLLTTRPLVGAGVAVRMRLGVVVVVRAPGRIVRRLSVVRARSVRGLLELTVANRGNITEAVVPRCSLVTILRGGVVAARLRPRERQLLPHTTGLVEVPVRRVRAGRVSVRVELGSGPPPCRSAPPKLFAVELGRLP